ncbi:MAG: hypothetical protein SGI88_09030 [Candidatus Hydrogenedentes bacterium]|nr:hypothetical protein [Candidatus Hydrogenedentota bacterium]
MAVMRWTKIRTFFGVVFAIVVLVGFVAIAAALFNVRLPILGEITDAVASARENNPIE